MTVAEPLDELQKHNPDTPVQSIAPYSDGGSITPVLPSGAGGSLGCAHHGAPATGRSS